MTRFAPVVLLSSIAMALVGSPPAHACTCLPTAGIEQVFADAEHVVRVNIRKEVRRVRRIPGVPTMDGTIRVYRAKVKESFKGCLRRGRIIKLVTSRDTGTCGAVLDRRKEYVVALGAGERGSFTINSCGFLRPTSSLSTAEREFLDTRYACCSGKCACTGTDPVPCLVDPCDADSCGDATCVPNFCGDCRAEFFGPAGQPVCTACDDDFDCGGGQVCDEGLCLPEVGCGTDDDCAADAWCRPTAVGGTACVPFVGEDETCAGFAPPWTIERCEPGLVCIVPPGPPETPPLPDAPGICVTP